MTSNEILDKVLEINMVKYHPEMRHYIPLEVRQQNYNKVRSKNFLNEELKADNYRNVPKVRQKFAEKRQVIKSVIDSIKRDNGTDPRSFGEVEVEGIKIKGLLDTGLLLASWEMDVGN